MDPLDLFIAAILSGLALLLLVQMIVAYSRVKNIKLLFLAGGFALFLIEGLLLLLGQAGIVSSPAISMSREMSIISLLIVLMLYAGTVKR